MDCLWHMWQGSWIRDGHSGLADEDKGREQAADGRVVQKGERPGGGETPSMAEQVPAPNSSDCLGHSSLSASGQAAEFGLRVQCCSPCCSGAHVSIHLPGRALSWPAFKAIQRASFWFSACPAQPRPPAALSSLARPAVLSLALPVLAMQVALPLLGKGYHYPF